MNDLDKARKYASIPSTGAQFERYLAMLFRDLGYRVKTTPTSGDFGADLILTNQGGMKHAVQAKFYNSGTIGVAPIQEVYASLAHWRADDGWVVTNCAFSKAANRLARENNVRLIDGVELNKLIGLALDGVILDENAEVHGSKSDEPISTDSQILKAKRSKSPMAELQFQADKQLGILEKHGDSIRLVIMCYCFADFRITQEMLNLYISIRQFKHKHIDWGFTCEESNALNSNKLSLQCISWATESDGDSRNIEKYREELRSVEEYVCQLEQTDKELIEQALHDGVDLKYLAFNKYQINEAVLPKIESLEERARLYVEFSSVCETICRYGMSAAGPDKNNARARYYEAVSNARTMRDFSSIARSDAVLDRFEAVMRACDEHRSGSAYRKVSFKPLASIFVKARKLFESYDYRASKIKSLYSNVDFDDKEDFLILTGAEALIDVKLEVQEIENDYQASIDELFSIIAEQQSLQEDIYINEDRRLRELYESEITDYQQSFEKLRAKYEESSFGVLKKSREKRIIEDYRAIQAINTRWNQENCIQLYIPKLPAGIVVN